MNRRSFLKLLSAGVIGYELDIEKLLWVPGQKKIFLPAPKHIVSLNEIVDIEIRRVLPQLRQLFERDDIFYRTLSSGHYTISGKDGENLKIPLNVRTRE